MLPLEISVRFSDGDEITEAWDGKGRYMELTYTGYRKVERVIIDPEYRIRMDVNFVNNSMTVKPDTVPLRSFTNKLLVLIQLFISIFTL